MIKKAFNKYLLTLGMEEPVRVCDQKKLRKYEDLLFHAFKAGFLAKECNCKNKKVNLKKD